MPDDATSESIYQLRVWLLGISPMIWRRLLVNGNSTIFDLHYILQIAFGWSDDHLNLFLIHGKEYGVAKPGGSSFRENARQVKLSDFSLRVGEKFSYEYNFTDNWQHRIRVEAILLPEPKHLYPKCIAGKGSVPPVDCGGPDSYLSLLGEHRLHPPLDELELVANAFSRVMQATELETIRDVVGDLYELQEAVIRLEDYYSFLSDRLFDRRKINRRLRQYATNDEAWLWE